MKLPRPKLRQALGTAAAFVRRHARSLLAFLALVAVLLFTITVAFVVDVGMRREPDAIIGRAIEMAENAKTLAEARHAVQSLQALLACRMSAGTRVRLLTALADAHRGHAEHDASVDGGSHHLDAAVRCYQSALSLCATPQDVWDIRLGLALVDEQRGEWDRAQHGYAAILARDMPAEKLASIQLRRARCLIEIGQMAPAKTILEEILGRYTAGAVQIQAETQFAELLIAELKRRQAADPNAESLAEQRGIDLDTDAIIQRSRDGLAALLERLGADDERRVRVLNGLLEVCILSGDIERAYQYVRALEGTVGHREQRIRSFDLLATLEESQGNLAEAESAMLFSLQEFPQHEKSHAMRLRLHRLRRDQGRLSESLDVLENLAKLVRGRPWLQRLTAELLPEDPAGVVNALTRADDGKAGLERLLRLVNSLQPMAAPHWLEVHEDMLYLRVVLTHRRHDYGAAEAAFIRYLVEAPFGNHLGDLLRIDADCAVRQGRDAAVRACRAHRYLAHFPEGAHSKEMLGLLMQAYYQMGLYDANLSLAEAAFVNAMLQTPEASSAYPQVPVLQATRWIAQCCSRLGNAGMAMALFNRCAPWMDELDPDRHFFLDWAGAARDAGQRREAIRRLEVGSRRLPAEADRNHLELARLETECLAGTPGAPHTARARLAAWQRQRTLPEAAMRPLYEQLLARSLAIDLGQVPELLAAAWGGSPITGWQAAWSLRYLREALEAGKREDAHLVLAGIHARHRQEVRAGTEPVPILRCLDHLDAIAALNQRVDELRDRGL